IVPPAQPMSTAAAGTIANTPCTTLRIILCSFRESHEFREHHSKRTANPERATQGCGFAASSNDPRGGGQRGKWLRCQRRSAPQLNEGCGARLSVGVSQSRDRY